MRLLIQAKNKKDKKKKKKDDDTEKIVKKPTVKLRAHGYEMTVRGGYDNVLSFLSRMNEHRELIEIQTVKIENEQGSERVGQGEPTVNPLKPIKLTTKLVLYLQPKL